MKKTALLFISICALSFKTNEEKKYKVELSLKEWQMVLTVIDQSNATHLQVKAVQELLIPVLNKQITDSTISKK